MSNNKQAVCIPTYNRPDVIREFLDTAIFRYIQRGFDIFIYDSGTNSETEEVVREAMCRHTALHYVRIDSTIHSNHKVYNIFQEFGGSREYEYLWVCSDSIRWTEYALDRVVECMKQGYDIIIPNYRDVEQIGDKEYTDKQVLFIDCAWHMTLYGATVLKVPTMLTEVKWDELIEKYLVPDCINHSHVAFYFEKLNVMKTWKAVHISLRNTDLIASGLKKFSGWQRETFYVWCHCWPTMIRKLPQEYIDKNIVIKKSGVNSEILSYQNMLQLREQGVLDRRIYATYKKEWKHLTEVPRRRMIFLISIPPSWIKYLDMRRNRIRVKEFFWKRKIRRFCRKYDDIYIYGAGKKAQRYTRYMEEMNLGFRAYLVSDAKNFVSELNGHAVLPCSKEICENENSGILLALNPQNAKEVLEGMLSEVNSKRVFFIEKEF